MNETDAFDDQEYRESFGDFLKRHREASGKSVEDVSRVTRIPKRFLAAFEDNDLARFPEDAFSRGFLRSYSVEVGLDVDEVLSRYDRFRRSLMPTQIKEIKKTSQFAELGSESGMPFRWTAQLSWGLVGIVLLVGLGAGISFLLSRNQEESKPVSEEVQALNNEAIETESGNAVVAPVVQAPKTLSTPVAPMTLSLTAKKKALIQVRLDEHPLVDVSFEVGESKTFNVFKEVEVKSLEKSAFQILYDGKAVETGSPSLKLVNRNLFTKPPKTP